MRILAVDISGKVVKYDNALYSEIIRNSGMEELIFLSPYGRLATTQSSSRLLQLVPSRLSGHENIIKRSFKALECLLNYSILGNILSRELPDVLHLQWLPFLDISLIEKYFLKRYKKRFKYLKIVLTIHNIYPHNFSDSQKRAYRERFLKIVPLIDNFIVHNNYTRRAVNKEYGIKEDRISVIKHGAFIPDIVPERNQYSERIRVLMYGYQSWYKGSDLLLDAIDLMSRQLKDKLDIRVLGRTAADLVDRFGQYTNVLTWKNEFLTDEDLYQEIANADILLYPYRQISQSGALLLGLAFNKPIIASNLVPFVETLEHYPANMFFQSEDAASLISVIDEYLNSSSEFKERVLKDILRIKNANLWEVSALDTLMMYRNITQQV